MADCLTLKKSNCKNCYKCIRNCAVKSIRFTDNQAHIIPNECILCGRCVVVCPQHAKEIVEEADSVRKMIENGEEVYVSLAPSFAANYPGIGIKSMRKALMALGFKDVEETAIGATYVKREYERLIREDKPDILITSCCHSVNLLIQKHFPDLLPYLADVLSPMQAHCSDLKKRHPGAKTVFIGPCLSKKDEAQAYPGIVDAVLTFEELSDWLVQEEIELEKNIDCDIKSRARLFPTPGGVLRTFTEEDPEYTYLAIDGVQSCIDVLKDIQDGEIHNTLIEMSSCKGSCVCGPAMEVSRRHPVRGYRLVDKYAGKEDFDVAQPEKDSMRKEFKVIKKRLHQPTEAEIRIAMHQLGKYTPADELNCGTCGYDSCRDKAIAICQGKADASMCLPHLKEYAVSFSNNIVSNSPNGIVVLDENLNITQINSAACKMFDLMSPSDVLNEMVAVILDPGPFLEAMDINQNVDVGRVFMQEYGKYVEMRVIYEEKDHHVFAILEDVTAEETERREKEIIFQQTVKVADDVVDKQMRIVQEIASLLGETTAETKIVLTKLKESIKNG